MLGNLAFSLSSPLIRLSRSDERVLVVYKLSSDEVAISVTSPVEVGSFSTSSDFASWNLSRCKFGWGALFFKSIVVSAGSPLKILVDFSKRFVSGGGVLVEELL